jgi:bile acid-coenzyme A ligase
MTDTETETSFGRRLTLAAAEKPEEIAITFLQEDGGVRYVTWLEVEQNANQIAHGLSEQGLTVGDRIAIEIKNSPEHIFAVFAGWKCGATIVPVRWDLPEWERERVLAAIDPKIALRGKESVHEPIYANQPVTPLPDVIPTYASGICSSGSTGSPKVILRLSPGLYDSSMASAKSFVNPLDPDKRAVMIIPAPAYHNNGYLASLELVAGRSIILLERFSPDLMLDAIEIYKGTGFVGATIMLQRMARHPRTLNFDFSGLDWLMQGASSVPDWLVEFWIERVGADNFILTYGSSELIGTTTCRGSEWLAHRGTCGRPSGELEIKIVDENGNEQPPGQIGLITMRNRAGFGHRYLGAGAATATATADLPDGFQTLGDLGWVDEDGYLYMSDRRTDLIVTGGANVYPAEVEAALTEHPDIDDVVVVGLPDPEWGTRVHAIVQTSARRSTPLDPDEVIAWAKERLASYKVPKSIEFVDQIPRTEAMKVNRSAMLEERIASAP